MPNINDILVSVGTPQLIKDAEIRAGEFQRDNRGNLIHYTGGFTVVFPVTVRGQKWAFRCWHVNTGIDSPRMKVLSEAISASHLKYLCDFKYVDEGVIVGGKVYPTSKMRWISGDNINEYILSHKYEKDTLKKLAQDFLDMTHELHCRHIAHGDLQHGNIMVTSDGELFLVDYDSMYCPEMGSVADTIKGKEDFQHPARYKNDRASDKLDYFSELIIFTSILAIAENPALLNKYNIEDSLLFKKSDYQDLEHSQIFTDMVRMGGIFTLLMDFLKKYLRTNDINELEPIKELLDRNLSAPEIIKFECIEGNKVVVGAEAKLCFQANHIERLRFNGEEINKNEMSRTVKPAHSGRFVYTLEASNWRHTIIKEITLEVVDAPVVNFRLSQEKLRRGKNEICTIEWNAKNLENLVFHEGTSDKTEEIGISGCKTVVPKGTTQYHISGIALDGKTKHEEHCTVFVYEESSASFNADKRFAFAGIPITLTWRTKNANRVKLDGKSVEKCGSCVISEGIVKDRTFTLTLEDEFGVKEEKVFVKLLPLPIVSSISVPNPNLTVSLEVNATIPMPKPAVELSANNLRLLELPNVEFPKANVVSLQDFGIPRISLPEPIRWWQINKVYEYIKLRVKRKLKNHTQDE